MSKIKKISNNSLTNIRSENLAQIPQESVWLANFTSNNTKATYSVSVREFFHFHRMIDQNDLRSSTQAHIISWRDAMIEAGMAVSTINSRISALSSLFNFLCEKQLMERNPVQGIKRPKVEQDQVKSPVLTTKQARSILDAPGMDDFKGIRATAILSIYFYTGCRRAEVGSLKFKHLLEDNGYYVIDFKVKGGKRNRVPVHPELNRILEKYLKVANHIVDGDTPLFISTSNNRDKSKLSHLTPKSFNELFNKYVAIAGLPRIITPHSARATFITQALENNCDIKAVQTTVKHANIATTMMYDKRSKKYKDSASLVVKF